MNKDWLDISVLEDYLDGKLDAKTMNRVEREALDDPFVAEALAGLSESPKRSLQSISMLQKQLHERVAELQSVKKTSVITWQRLSIAATAAVMFIAVSVMFWMRENNLQKELAGRPKKVDVAIAPRNPAETPAVQADQVQEKEIDQAIKDAKTNTYAARVKPKIKSAIPQTAPQQLNEVAITGYAVQQKRSMTGAVSSVMVLNATNVLSGKVVAQDDGKPLPGVSVRISGTDLTAVTDSNGEFKIKADTAIKEGKLYVSYIGFKPMELLAKANQPVNVSLAPDHLALNEVVVTGFGKAKKERIMDSAKLNTGTPRYTTNVQIRGLSTLPNKEAMISNPIGGWEKLFEYIKTNNTFAKSETAGQSVELSFNIDKDGSPTAIKVLKGADDKYEEEAIRLIINGPKWEQPKKAGSKMTFIIDF
ncbi:energy transducer TonB [Pedobacter nyackensis]|uniref:CarboxypepD_reg-like domain-containing protein n=1 Tax=Pedobacter nyackensis TaxID=475255 RepID=A0A1W2BH87_9SPHI|nr:carboxypeptidase-like regulatory domain-containing protein [Pedobacter nyackensis]SMC72303.1 CarboxypepD_reg-like domain-containing protein [Pedobacter nyackensis]